MPRTRCCGSELQSLPSATHQELAGSLQDCKS